MKSPSLWKTIGVEIFSFQTIFWAVLFGIFYLFSIQLLLNFRLLSDSVARGFSFSSTLILLFSLFLGAFTSLAGEPLTLSILFLNAFFVGLNLVLLGKALASLQGKGKVHLSLGGATLFSLATAGCASCGLSLLSVIGLSASLAFLPFHGAELRVVSLGLLVVSALYMLRELHEAKYCKV